MCLVVYLGEVLEIKVGIDLGRRDVRMPEQFLNPPQVVTRLEYVRCERVPKQVREDIGVDALATRPVLDARLYRTSTEPRAAVVDE